MSGTLTVRKVNGNTNFQHVKLDVVKREVYLTFDDGIQAGTEEVLEVLKETGVKGTFFLQVYIFIILLKRVRTEKKH